jgi:hypothetical protein
MQRCLSICAFSTMLLGASPISGYAVTSEPEAPAGAPATSAPPATSATEQHEGKGMTGPEGAQHKEGTKQEAQERKAIQHTQKAITQGRAGNVQGLRKHAETALKMAERAEQRHAEGHVEEGIKHLKLAVEEAKNGKVAEGTKHAEEALTHLKQK